MRLTRYRFSNPRLFSVKITVACLRDLIYECPKTLGISPNRIVYTASAGCGFLDYRLTRAGWLSSLTVRIAYSFAHNLNTKQFGTP
jgi:hypothetical protein